MDKIKNINRSFLQLFPSFKGKLRLGKMLYRLKHNPEKSVYTKVKYNIRFRLPNLVDSIGYELYFNGQYENETIDYIINKIPPNGIFIDVGANIGAISIFVAHKRPDVQVYAIEASEKIYNYLKENVSLNNLSNIRTYNFIIHNVDDKEIKLYAPDDQFGKGSLEKTFTTDYELIKTITLNTFITNNKIHPDLIKVDVQGYELFVFQGLESFIRNTKQRPEILFEFEDWSEEIAMGKENISIAQKYLKTIGYTLYNLKGNHKYTSQEFCISGSKELIGRWDI